MGNGRKCAGVLLSSLLAGICIGIGGTVFLSVDNRVLGASLFSLGLFFVVSFGLWLYTGRIGYLPERDGAFAVHLLVTLAGNFAGASALALLLRQTRAAAALTERAAALCAVKLGDSPVSMFLLAVCCGVLMYAGVHGYASFPYAAGKYLSVYLAVSVFILCGFEHCVANMYYYALGGVWGDGRAWLSMLAAILGNSVGAVAFARILALQKRLQE